MDISKETIKKLKVIRDASVEQLDSIEAIEGAEVHDYVMILMHLRRLTTTYEGLIQQAIDAGFDLEDRDAHQVLAAIHIKAIADIVADIMSLSNKEIDSAFRWTDTVLDGADQRIIDAFGKEK